MELNYKIYTLREIPWFISEIADIYLLEWGWYYREEHNIMTTVDMIEYLYKECMDTIYIIMTDTFNFIGTLMLILKNKDRPYDMKCYPLISYLYINKEYKEHEYEYSKILMNNIYVGEVYTWCYLYCQIENFKKLGFKEHYDYVYNSFTIYILKKEEFVNR